MRVGRKFEDSIVIPIGSADGIDPLPGVAAEVLFGQVGTCSRTAVKAACAATRTCRIAPPTLAKLAMASAIEPL